MGPEWPTGCTTAPGATTSSRSVHSLLHCLLSCFCSFVSAPVFCSPCKTSLTTLLTGTGPSWELHGPRVAHRLHHRTRCHNIKQICTLFTALSSLMLLLIRQRTSVLQSLQNKPDLVDFRLQPMYVHVPLSVCDSSAGAGKVAMEMKARRQWRKWRWSSYASPWLLATRAACTWCWRASPPRPPTSWKTELPIPSSTDRLAVGECGATTLGKLCHFFLSLSSPAHQCIQIAARLLQ